MDHLNLFREQFPEVKGIGVIGAGIMGHGIAHVAAAAGYTVTLFDLEPAFLDRALGHIRKNLEGGVEKGKITHADLQGTLSRIATSTSLKETVDQKELVIEAIPEKLPLKIELFGRLSTIVKDDTILASNTSSLSIGAIAAAAARPERIVGMHFFNPPHILKLLELVSSGRTSPDALASVKKVAEKMQREIVVVKDSPGFATSRLGVLLGLEAMRMVEEGVASAEDIDKAMVHGYKHPMGPLRLSDLIGLDTRLEIAEYLHRELKSDAFKPPLILREKVRIKHLGQKTGEGFYHWEK